MSNFTEHETGVKKGVKHIVKTPDVAYLTECFHYNETTGMLSWKERPLHHFKNEHGMRTCNSRHAGKLVTRKCVRGGKNPHGYDCYSVMLNSKSLKAHRVIWKLLHGFDSPLYIDHIDGNRLNNRADNLREATAIQNRMNTRAARIKANGLINFN